MRIDVDDRAIRVIMGGNGFCLLREGERSAVGIGSEDREVAVANPREELDGAAEFGRYFTPQRSDFALHVRDNLFGLGGRDVPGGEILHHAVFKGNQVATKRPILGA